MTTLNRERLEYLQKYPEGASKLEAIELVRIALASLDADHNRSIIETVDGMKKYMAELREGNAGLTQESCVQQQRIAALSGNKRLIGWRASDYTDETSDPELAKNWAAAIGVLPIFEGDVNTKLRSASIQYDIDRTPSSLAAGTDMHDITKEELSLPELETARREFETAKQLFAQHFMEKDRATGGG